MPLSTNVENLLYKDFYYPEHAGFPIGKADSPKVVILEIHYDNPENKKGTLLKLMNFSSTTVFVI